MYDIFLHVPSNKKIQYKHMCKHISASDKLWIIKLKVSVEEMTGSTFQFFTQVDVNSPVSDSEVGFVFYFPQASKPIKECKPLSSTELE